MPHGERGAARTDYTISLSLTGVLVAIAMPRLPRREAGDAGLLRPLWPWLMLAAAAAILVFAGHTWWHERRRR